MDFSSAGWKDGVLRALKVAGWVALSGAVSALIAYLGSLHVDPSQITAVAIVGLLNAILAGLKDWLDTKRPTA